MEKMSEWPEWQRLKAELKRLWETLVNKGYAGWIAWLLKQAIPA
jgi:hypothetical protein